MKRKVSKRHQEKNSACELAFQNRCKLLIYPKPLNHYEGKVLKDICTEHLYHWM